MFKIDKYYLLALITGFLTYILVPLFRNSLERVYKTQIDSFLAHSVRLFAVIVFKLIQLILILLFLPTLLSKIPGFMREKAEEEYKPVAKVILDKNFPLKMKVSWKAVRGTIFGISLGYVLMVLIAVFGIISQSSEITSGVSRSFTQRHILIKL